MRSILPNTRKLLANNISYLASANELLRWFKANPNTPRQTTIWYQLQDKAELCVEP